MSVSNKREVIKCDFRYASLICLIRDVKHTPLCVFKNPHSCKPMFSLLNVIFSAWVCYQPLVYVGKAVATISTRPKHQNVRVRGCGRVSGSPDQTSRPMVSEMGGVRHVTNDV